MFSKSNAKGKKAERELVDYLKNIGFQRVEFNDKYDDRYLYDICSYYEGCWLSWEVKNDLMSYLTGNLAFEYHNSKKNEPSGYCASKAIFWVHKFDNKLHYCLLKTLKEFITSNKPYKNIKAGGDENSNFYVYRKSDIIHIFKEIQKSKIEDFISEYALSEIN